LLTLLHSHSHRGFSPVESLEVGDQLGQLAFINRQPNLAYLGLIARTNFVQSVMSVKYVIAVETVY